jgi:GntR family transcriptional repressor for pyruvate dehydrogenase complex
VTPKSRKNSDTAVLDRLSTAMGPIRSEGLTEHLVRRMKDCILQGVINPGERLPPERELAIMLNVSRSSLRQALKAFQVMGVLEVKQGSGNYLTQSAGKIVREPVDLLMPLRGITFAELFEARRAMEAESAACAAVRANKHDLDNMDAEIEQMRLAGEDFARFTQHDAKFHRAIATASGNSVFVWVVALVQHVLMGAHIAHAKASKLPRIRDEHHRILEAIRSRNADQARSEMLAHLTLSRHYTDQPAPFELRGFTAAPEELTPA